MYVNEESHLTQTAKNPAQAPKRLEDRSAAVQMSQYSWGLHVHPYQTPLVACAKLAVQLRSST